VEQPPPPILHATLARNLPSILRAGLLTSKSQGKLPVVWVCCPSKSSWAILHVVKRPGGRVETTVVLEVDVPRRWLRRSRKGLWYCPRDVPPDRIRRAVCFSELVGQSTDA
jgi:hypothetical protein